MENPKISIVIPVVERYDGLQELYAAYTQPFRDRNVGFESIFVVDGKYNDAFDELRGLKEQNPEIRIIKFSKNFFEAVALMVGFEHARGEYVFTLASYYQVVPEVIPGMLDTLERGEADMVITRRFPRKDNIVNRIQAACFHFLVSGVTSFSFKDISCSLRGMKAEVAKSLNLSGDLHRFMPILAYQLGYTVTEMKATQRKEDTRMRYYGIGVYVRRMIDIVSLFFLIKFTRKPLRFFGLIGVNVFLVGTAVTAYLGYVRLFAGAAIAGRPLLLLGLLCMVLGIQVMSLGLLGELIIFTRARDLKEYHVGEVIE